MQPYVRFLGRVMVCFLCFYILLGAKTIYISQLDDVYLTSIKQDSSLFVDQDTTGTYATTNCGPSSLQMIFKWLGVDMGSVASIRSHLTHSDGYVYTNQIEDYLDPSPIDYDKLHISKPEKLLKAVDAGMLLLCIDASKITYNPDTTIRIGKEYEGVTGHFIVATGYYKDAKETYIQVLDPLNTNVRYYKLSELYEAITSWYSYVYLFQLPLPPK